MACAPAARRDHDLASGPGKLSQAFGLDRSFDGADLVTGNHGIVIASDGMRPRRAPRPRSGQRARQALAGLRAGPQLRRR
ncbi:hypothetical protein C7E17_11305 [Stenotrophomonas maltophilia]|nr:hypothetical protein C7E17_11305 [Stenotrophomonas maltophilia]